MVWPVPMALGEHCQLTQADDLGLQAYMSTQTKIKVRNDAERENSVMRKYKSQPVVLTHAKMR